MPPAGKSTKPASAQPARISGPGTAVQVSVPKKLAFAAVTIVALCAAAEVIVNPVSDWIFKTPQNDAYAVQAIYGTMNDMGIEKIGVVAANSGFGNAGVGQLEKFAPEFGIEIVITESYDRAATDLTALMTKVNAAGVEAVVNWSIVDAQSIMAGFSATKNGALHRAGRAR